MQEEETSNATTKLIAILAFGIAVAITSTAVILTESQTAAQGKSIGKGHDLGQCYKTQNKLLQDAGLKGKEKSDRKKALCEYDPG